MVEDRAKKRARQVRWKRARRDAYLSSQGNRCRLCGAGPDSSAPFEIDHVDPRSKCIRIADIWSYSDAKRLPELAKCQVLCASCHREKSKKDGSIEKWHAAHIPNEMEASMQDPSSEYEFRRRKKHLDANEPIDSDTGSEVPF
jgi:hypothetical protein